MSFIRNSLQFFRSTTVPLEGITAGVATIDTNHAQIHASNAFSALGALTVLAAGTGGLQIYVPPGAYVHLQALSFSASSGPGMVEIYEDASISGGGSPVTTANHHRLRPVDSLLTLTDAAAATKVDGPGVVLLGKIPLHGFSQGQTKVNAESGQPEEWILRPDTNYLVLLSNMDTSSIVFGYNFFWYEEESA